MHQARVVPETQDGLVWKLQGFYRARSGFPPGHRRGDRQPLHRKPYRRPAADDPSAAVGQHARAVLSPRLCNAGFSPWFACTTRSSRRSPRATPRPPPCPRALRLQIEQHYTEAPDRGDAARNGKTSRVKAGPTGGRPRRPFTDNHRRKTCERSTAGEVDRFVVAAMFFSAAAVRAQTALTLWSHWADHDSKRAFVEGAARTFEKANPGVTVSLLVPEAGPARRAENRTAGRPGARHLLRRAQPDRVRRKQPALRPLQGSELEQHRALGQAGLDLQGRGLRPAARGLDRGDVLQ